MTDSNKEKTYTSKEKTYTRETKKLLRNYNQIKLNIEILKEEKERADLVVSLPAITYDSVNVQTSASNDGIEKDAMRLMHRNKMIDLDIKENEYLLNKIDRAINSLPELDAQIVRLFYIEKNSWNSIVRSMCYSERALRYKRDEAVLSIAVALFGSTVLKR